MRRRRLYLLASAALVVAVLSAFVAWRLMRPGPLPEGVDMAAHPAPDFRLTDQFGSPVQLAGLRGKVVLVTFIDSVCIDVCDLTAQEIARLQDGLGERARDLAVLAINVNARHNSVTDVLAYSRKVHMLDRWRFLTGDAAALQKVWADYFIGVQDSPTGVVHQVAVYVIDRQGRERALLLPGNEPAVEAERIEKDVWLLL